jgi:hypothetical protein
MHTPVPCILLLLLSLCYLLPPLLLLLFVAQIDGMKNRVLMKRFNVMGFPSIYLLKDGSTWQYTGTRTVADVSGCCGQGCDRVRGMQ